MIPRLLVLLIPGICCQLICPAQFVWDKSNMTIAKIEKDGIVRDRNNMTIGKFDSDSNVRDRNNMLAGKIEKNGAIRD